MAAQAKGHGPAGCKAKHLRCNKCSKKGHVEVACRGKAAPSEDAGSKEGSSSRDDTALAKVLEQITGRLEKIEDKLDGIQQEHNNLAIADMTGRQQGSSEEDDRVEFGGVIF